MECYEINRYPGTTRSMLTTILLLMLTARRAVGHSVYSSLHPNGLLEVRLSRPFEAMEVEQLGALERILDTVDPQTAGILLITSAPGETRGATPSPLSPLSAFVGSGDRAT